MKKKKENYRLTSLINTDAKILQKYLQTKFNNSCKRIYLNSKWERDGAMAILAPGKGYTFGKHWEIVTVKQCQIQDPEISVSPLQLLSMLHPELLQSPKPALSFG